MINCGLSFFSLLTCGQVVCYCTFAIQVQQEGSISSIRARVEFRRRSLVTLVQPLVGSSYLAGKRTKLYLAGKARPIVGARMQNTSQVNRDPFDAASVSCLLPGCAYLAAHTWLPDTWREISGDERRATQALAFKRRRYESYLKLAEEFPVRIIFHK